MRYRLAGQHLSRRAFVGVLAAAPLLLPEVLRAEGARRTFRFSVLSLFHPQRLLLHAPAQSTLHYDLDGKASSLARNELLTISITNGRLVANGHEASALQIASPTDFELEVPSKLRRRYQGTLRVDVSNGVLRSLVGIEQELAVASIVGPESPPHATPNALAAQAIAVRSFLLGSHHAHTGFDFCDTTHCQYLREPPPPHSAAALATQRTSGLVLDASTADSQRFVLAAMYSRSCGGRTRTLAELGLPAAPYPYYAVPCAYCRQHPELWQREASTIATTEHARLSFNRIHGWSALPGNNGVLTADHQLHGSGIGHGLGLCQLGAADMSARGATIEQILAHYYPNTRLGS